MFDFIFQSWTSSVYHRHLCHIFPSSCGCFDQRASCYVWINLRQSYGLVIGRISVATRNDHSLAGTGSVLSSIFHNISSWLQGAITSAWEAQGHHALRLSGWIVSTVHWFTDLEFILLQLIFVFCVILLQKQISLGQHAMCCAEFPRPETCACFDRRF